MHALGITYAISVPLAYGAGDWMMVFSVLLTGFLGVFFSRDRESLPVTLSQSLPSALILGIGLYSVLGTGSLTGAVSRDPIIERLGRGLIAGGLYGFVNQALTSFVRGLSTGLLRAAPGRPLFRFSSKFALTLAAAVLIVAILLAVQEGRVRSNFDSLIPDAVRNWIVMIGLLAAMPVGDRLGHPIGDMVGQRLAPMVMVFGRAWPLLRLMLIPVAGFALGYLATVAVFGGLYASLNRAQPSGSFQYVSGNASAWEFVFFSMMTITTLGYSPIIPTSPAAQLLTFVEAFIGAAWWSVVIAVFLALLAPQFERVARNDARSSSRARASRRSRRQVSRAAAKPEEGLQPDIRVDGQPAPANEPRVG